MHSFAFRREFKRKKREDIFFNHLKLMNKILMFKNALQYKKSSINKKKVSCSF